MAAAITLSVNPSFHKLTVTSSAVQYPPIVLQDHRTNNTGKLCHFDPDLSTATVSWRSAFLKTGYVTFVNMITGDFLLGACCSELKI